MGADALELQFNSALRTHVCPNFILPLPSSIRLDTLGRAEGAKPTNTEDIPNLQRIFGQNGQKQRILGEHIRGMQSNEITQKRKANLRLLVKHQYCGCARNRTTRRLIEGHADITSIQDFARKVR